MRILHVIDSLARGGAETLLINTIERLPDDEHILINISGKFEFEEQIKLKFTYYSLNCTSKVQWVSGILRLKKIIRKHKPDLVHAHSYLAALFSKFICPRAIPFFYSIHAIYSSTFLAGRWARKLERITAKPYHHLIGVSRAAIQDYAECVPQSGTQDILYNFVADKFFKIQQTPVYEPGQRLNCVAIGNARYQKNYIYMLQNFLQLKNIPVFLDIYGSGFEKEGLKQFATDNLLEKIAFKNASNNIEEILPRYHLFLSCSRLEGFGIAPMEAMAAGIPVIVSDIPAYTEVIGESGIMVSLSDCDGLAVILSDIFKGNIPIKTFGEAGRRKALDIAGPDDYIVRLKTIYTKYLKN